MLCYLTIPSNTNDSTKRPTLEELFGFFSRTETLLRENYVNSEQRNFMYNLKKEVLWQTSEYLYLPIQNRLLLGQERNLTKISVPLQLNIEDYLHPNSPQKNSDHNQYKLIAVSWHGGDSSNGGHYISWCLYDNDWYSFNDNNPVKKLTNYQRKRDFKTPR